MPRQVWIGLVEVAPQAGNTMFGDAPGAFTNALASADSREDYGRKVEAAMRDKRLDVRGIEDAEPLDERRTKSQVPEAIIGLAEKASETVVWDTFYVFRSVGP
jgi:hypothetical protein